MLPALFLPPQTVDGNPSYQTFLVQVAATPEPGFFALLALGLAGLFAVSYYRRAAATLESPIAK